MVMRRRNIPTPPPGIDVGDQSYQGRAPRATGMVVSAGRLGQGVRLFLDSS